MNQEQFGEIKEALGRIEQKIDGHVEHDNSRFDAQTAKNADLYEQVGDLQAFRSRTKGVARGVSIAAGVVTSTAAIIAKATGLV